MKTNTILLPLVALTFSTSLWAAKPAGPNGGRVLHAEPQKAEFFVTPERHAQITFLDATLNPAAPSGQQVTAIAEVPGQRTTLEFERTETGFVSRASLPESTEPYRVVVQIRSAPDAKPTNYRIDLNLSECGECGHAEYACTCEGH